MNLNLKQLRAFAAVVDTGSVTAAADFLNITQPAISKSISSLEEEVGFKVFERTHQRLQITELGKLLFDEASRVLSIFDDFDGIVEDLKSHGKQRIRIVASTVVSYSQFLAEAISACMQKHDYIQVHLESQSRMNIQQHIASGKADLGVSFLPFPHPGISTIPIGTSPIVTVVSTSSPLADYDELGPSELCDEGIIIPRESSRLRQIIENQFFNAGIRPRIRSQTGNSIISCRLASAGVGVAICDSLSVKTAGIPCVLKKKWQRPTSLEYGILTRENTQMPKYLRYLATLIEEKFAEHA